MLQSNVGGAGWLPKKFEAAEIQAHPSDKRDRYTTKCWFKNFLIAQGIAGNLLEIEPGGK